MPPKPRPIPSSPGGVVSMRDVAAAAGVSRMSVSRAFRPGAPVRPELRERILGLAERMGYRPDPLATELMSSFAQRRPVNYRETLGVLWWPERWNQTKNPESFAARLSAGLEAAAVKHGCRLTPFVIGDGARSALDRTLAARHIQGIVITPPTEPDTVAPKLDWTKLSVMVVGRSLPAPTFNRVHQHHYGALVQVVERLKGRGFKRPVLLVNVGLEERMQRAYTGAFLAHDAGPPENVLHMDSFAPERLERRLRRLSPDVIVADVEAWVETLRALPRLAGRCGLVVMDVARKDGALSGVHQNAARMGEAAIDLLMQARLRHETGVPAEPISVLTPGLWVEGKTLDRADAGF